VPVRETYAEGIARVSAARDHISLPMQYARSNRIRGIGFGRVGCSPQTKIIKERNPITAQLQLTTGRDPPIESSRLPDASRQGLAGKFWKDTQSSNKIFVFEREP
jgi:hypothetical protein